MSDPPSDNFETRYEWLRPAQLVQRRDACPLVIVPVAPLEYHGPHLPLGCDMINVSETAHAVCRKLGRGVVRPVLSVGTGRASAPPRWSNRWALPPDRTWWAWTFPRGFGTVTICPRRSSPWCCAELEILIRQGYRYVFVASGHGADNQKQTIARLCIELQNTTPARLDHCLTLCDEALATGLAGHADIVETSLLLHYRRDAVDLSTLPPREVPIQYRDFSVVDGAGFSAALSPPAPRAARPPRRQRRAGAKMV